LRIDRSWGDDSDVVDSSLMAVVDDFGDLGEVEVSITFDEHGLVVSGGEDGGEL
jgi:hypothetical protein